MLLMYQLKNKGKLIAIMSSVIWKNGTEKEDQLKKIKDE